MNHVFYLVIRKRGFFFFQKALKQNNCKALTGKLKSVCELSGKSWGEVD